MGPHVGSLAELAGWCLALLLETSQFGVGYQDQHPCLWFLIQQLGALGCEADTQQNQLLCPWKILFLLLLFFFFSSVSWRCKFFQKFVYLSAREPNILVELPWLLQRETYFKYPDALIWYYTCCYVIISAQLIVMCCTLCGSIVLGLCLLHAFAVICKGLSLVAYLKRWGQNWTCYPRNQAWSVI